MRCRVIPFQRDTPLDCYELYYCVRVDHMSLVGWIQLLIIVALGTVAQLSLKAAMAVNETHSSGHDAVLRRLWKSPLMWVWFLCYAASTLLWLWALRELPLSQAFPILGLQFALVPLASSRFLGEKLGWAQWVGVLVIVVGVVLVGG